MFSENKPDLGMERLSITDQVVEIIRKGIQERRWMGTMPGREVLAREVKASPMTVIRALSRLEAEGVLVPGGPGRKRQIVLPAGEAKSRLRVSFLVDEVCSQSESEVVEARIRLEQQGYVVNFADKSLMELKMDVGRVARVVEKTEADAWVVIHGTAEVIRWFAGQVAPAYAWHGGMKTVDISGAGVDKSPACMEAARRLMDYGHKRIVLLQLAQEREDCEQSLASRFLQEMEARGISTGFYNHPTWPPSPAGLGQCLDSLYAHTPPSAFIISSAPLFHGVLKHLAYRNIHAPRDVSLVCMDESASFQWFDGSVACFHWDKSRFPERVVHWVKRVGQGMNARQQYAVRAQFVDGGTVGPVPRR
jgi:DNA-binding LacI/PurR family transcriptional regulator/DNA-binding transcriptional regulator YhcF (GntR family)